MVGCAWQTGRRGNLTRNPWLGARLRRQARGPEFNSSTISGLVKAKWVPIHCHNLPLNSEINTATPTRLGWGVPWLATKPSLPINMMSCRGRVRRAFSEFQEWRSPLHKNPTTGKEELRSALQINPWIPLGDLSRQDRITILVQSWVQSFSLLMLGLVLASEALSSGSALYQRPPDKWLGWVLLRGVGSLCHKAPRWVLPVTRHKPRWSCYIPPSSLLSSLSYK